MPTKEEMQQMMQEEIFDRQNEINNERFRSLSEEIKSMNDFMTQAVKNVEKRLDEHDVMTDNKLKLFREEPNQIISDKIRVLEVNILHPNAYLAS